MGLDWLVSVYAPFACVNCGRQGRLICVDCQPTVVINKRSSCYLCNRLADAWKVCASCRHKSALRGVVVASHYGGKVKDVIRLLKYQRAQAAAADLAGLLTPVVSPTQFDIVTWVPASTQRHRRRGYNPAQLIAKALARSLELPAAATLNRIGHARQVGTPRRLRQQQIQGKIYISNQPKVTGQRLLVIDDVVTTGATINECGKVLRTGGAKFVWGAAIAKH
ncbi:ComF family protein [Candidatus Microgenomates bacterium]|nr:ComF family protein [Candidatus Microgenomates bacterium]